MTLTLDGKTPYPDLVADFAAIPDTLLLFLTKIKELKFKIHFPDQGRSTCKIFRISAQADGTTCISKIEQGSNRREKIWYHVVREAMEGLPDDPARPEINECEGVLAFPIDEHGCPRLHTGYDIYAFLPVCTVGFNVSALKHCLVVPLTLVLVLAASRYLVRGKQRRSYY